MMNASALALSPAPTVVVMGLGYVGVAMIDLATTAGLDVIGFDVDSHRVQELEDRDGSATTDPARLGAADLILVCVPTPITPGGRPDRGAVLRAAELIRANARSSVRVCLESTVDPDFAADGFARAMGLSLDQVAHAPERINPGPTGPHPRLVPRVVGGCTLRATAWAAAFYRGLGLEVRETDAKVAALSKLAENTQRLINIAFMGELAQLCRAQGVDIDDVVDAAATKPFGYEAYRARAGAGGHCVPVDPGWLADAAECAGVELTTVNAALISNRRRALDVADTLTAEAPKARNILLIGAAYKPDVADTRESAAWSIAARLTEQGCQVRVCDPLTGGLYGYAQAELDPDTLAWADAILLLTAHTSLSLLPLVDYDGALFDACGGLRALMPGRGRRL